MIGKSALTLHVDQGVPRTTSHPDDLFFLLFRSAYFSMICGFTAFTCLGFARLGTLIGLFATIIVALGSEIAFACQRREQGRALKYEGHMV
jgi:hypothetical protein